MCKGHTLGPWTMQRFIVALKLQSYRVTVTRRCHSMEDHSGKEEVTSLALIDHFSPEPAVFCCPVAPAGKRQPAI